MRRPWAKSAWGWISEKSREWDRVVNEFWGVEYDEKGNVIYNPYPVLVIGDGWPYYEMQEKPNTSNNGSSHQSGNFHVIGDPIVAEDGTLPSPESPREPVIIRPGHTIDAAGREIIVPESSPLDQSTSQDPPSSDGNFMRGELPSGTGVPGGIFESWFRPVHSEPDTLDHMALSPPIGANGRGTGAIALTDRTAMTQDDILNGRLNASSSPAQNTVSRFVQTDRTLRNQFPTGWDSLIDGSSSQRTPQSSTPGKADNTTGDSIPDPDSYPPISLPTFGDASDSTASDAQSGAGDGAVEYPPIQLPPFGDGSASGTDTGLPKESILNDLTPLRAQDFDWISFTYLSGDDGAGSSTNQSFLSYENIEPLLILQNQTFGLDMDTNYRFPDRPSVRLEDDLEEEGATEDAKSSGTNSDNPFDIFDQITGGIRPSSVSGSPQTPDSRGIGGDQTPITESPNPASSAGQDSAPAPVCELK